MHIAIQGETASFHELAAIEHYSEPLTFLYCQTFTDVFRAVQDGLVDRGFVASANSSHGSIKEVRQLLKSFDTVIDTRYQFAVHQHLIGLPGARVAQIKTILSHPVALSQCSEFLSAYATEPFYDTAAAIKYVKRQSDLSLAAVGSREAATLYGLEVLKENIHNSPDNHTIFVSFKKT